MLRAVGRLSQKMRMSATRGRPRPIGNGVEGGRAYVLGVAKYLSRDARCIGNTCAVVLCAPPARELKPLNLSPLDGQLTPPVVRRDRSHPRTQAPARRRPRAAQPNHGNGRTPPFAPKSPHRAERGPRSSLPAAIEHDLVIHSKHRPKDHRYRRRSGKKLKGQPTRICRHRAPFAANTTNVTI